ncbi:predicted protein [Uncinocarpus reesii 1704]|uniref:Uncharacterized protein n=1 Tax=Uncinocarpus reesii (strain UAMH 1704) TaxID=336963 RepID=C4RRN3_UNCRE|nr:uncharacterized protein UREG_07933 [Uncinocarpus reesii 1704]EEP78111.1 predicted protein [Uncinocarpus reesii 1704]
MALFNTGADGVDVLERFETVERKDVAQLERAEEEVEVELDKEDEEEEEEEDDALLREARRQPAR